MNLKEAFRYQTFLDNLMRDASSAIRRRENCFRVTRNHLISASNTEGEDREEVILPGSTLSDTYFPNDTVISFMLDLIREKEEVTKAVDSAKTTADIDIDADIATNKYRRTAINAIKSMLSMKGGTSMDSGKGYKFNAEGNQVPFFYDIDETREEAYDRASSKKLVKSLSKQADDISAAVDHAMVSTEIYFTPAYDVNDSYEDAISAWIASSQGSEGEN